MPLVRQKEGERMMRKVSVMRLVVAAVCCWAAGSLYATSYSQKTFFSPRAVGANRAMEYTTWHDIVFPKIKAPSKSSINSHVAVTAFYQASQKDTELGKFLGIGNGKNYFKVGTVANFPGGGGDSSTEVVNGYLIHIRVINNNNLAGTVYFAPKQEIFGVHLNYFQDINSPFKKFFFKVGMPVVYMKNDMKMTVKDPAGVTPNGAAPTVYQLTDFFKGSVSVESSALNPFTDAQTSLTKAKINKCRSAAGIADLNLALGYKLHQASQNYCFWNGGVIIPTGNSVRGDYLFDAIIGNGQHFGVSTGVDAGLTLWEEKGVAVSMQVAADYRYLFEGTEERTLSLNAAFFPVDGGNKLSHYYLLGKNNAVVHTQLTPAANIFTRGLRVLPGSQFETLANISFKCSGFIVDLGYNLFFKDKESVWIKSWTDGEYGVAGRDFDTSHGPFTIAAGTVGNKAIAKSDFDIESVTQPTQVTHKVLGGLGYTFTLAKKYVSGLGAGASYEFASDNAAMENYAFWVKGSIAF